MATIYEEGGGRRVIQFVGPDKKRRKIRLGKVSQREAESMDWLIKKILESRFTGDPLDVTAAKKLGEMGDGLHARFAAAGLCEPRQPAAPQDVPTLGRFLNRYNDGLRAVKSPRTIINNRASITLLVDFFGADTPLADITPGDADTWAVHLRSRTVRGKQGYAPATIGRAVKRAKQFFRAAVRHRLIEVNPFADLETPSQRNDARRFIITRDAAAKVLAACPDAEWRLIFALSRFGGLRCPSETLALKWADVDWLAGTFTVRSSKTGDRVVPIFADLRPYLEAAFDPEAVYVIQRYRDSSANLRTQLNRILKRACLKVWPRLFHNLRATRQTELTEDFPSHVVCKWLGNSEDVARAHYLQVTDDHIRRAAGNAGGTGGGSSKSGAKSGALCAVLCDSVRGTNCRKHRGSGTGFTK
jgi:integrase